MGGGIWVLHMYLFINNILNTFILFILRYKELFTWLVSNYQLLQYTSLLLKHYILVLKIHLKKRITDWDRSQVDSTSSGCTLTGLQDTLE